MRSLALLLFACSAQPSAPIGDPHVSGVVTDVQGAPWADAKVQVCSATLCTVGSADGAGAFSVKVPAGSRYHVIAHAAPADPRDTSAGLAVLGDVVTTDIAIPTPIAIPITGARQPLPSATVTEDLTLTANAEDIGFSSDAYFSGVSVAAPPYVAIAAWALGPWGARTNPGKTIAVTIANHFGLAPGDAVLVYAVDESTAELGPPSQATVSPDGKTITGATIDRVTWIVLTR